ncbi:hypothetical protein D7X25_15270 [bacterium 1XD42-8]|jgi:hypothetical protein|nr:hypothetical protein D7X25_15270 [bacterium 1XD42-8]
MYVLIFLIFFKMLRDVCLQHLRFLILKYIVTKFLSSFLFLGLYIKVKRKYSKYCRKFIYTSKFAGLEGGMDPP